VSTAVRPDLPIENPIELLLGGNRVRRAVAIGKLPRTMTLQLHRAARTPAWRAHETQLVARIGLPTDAQQSSRRSNTCRGGPDLITARAPPQTAQRARVSKSRPSIRSGGARCRHVVSGFVVGEHVRFTVTPDMGREGHLAHGREQAAVGFGRDRRESGPLAQRLYCSEKIASSFGSSRIGRLVAALAEHLRENRAAQTGCVRARDPEEPIRLTGIGSQTAGSASGARPRRVQCRHDQRQGSDHSLAFPPSSRRCDGKGILPTGMLIPSAGHDREPPRARIEQGASSARGRAANPVCREFDSISAHRPEPPPDS